MRCKFGTLIPRDKNLIAKKEPRALKFSTWLPPGGAMLDFDLAHGSGTTEGLDPFESRLGRS